MNSFLLRTKGNELIRFNLYSDSAPKTTEAFLKILPFTRTFFHAKVSGQEIWIDNAPELDIIQENASVFAEPGEIVLGPIKPERVKTKGCLGIFYGEGRGLDACNIFGRVTKDDFQQLKNLGEKIWREGAQEISFELPG
jgi:hypothetical protein